MCFHSLKNTGKVFLLALGLFCLSLAAYSQEIENNQYLDPTQSNSLTNQMQDLPPLPIVQLDNSKPLTQRLAQELQAWINWRNQVMDWWKIQKPLLEKQMVDQQKAIDAKDSLIAGYVLEIGFLKDQLNGVKDDNIKYGIGGFLAGLVGGFSLRSLFSK